MILMRCVAMLTVASAVTTMTKGESPKPVAVATAVLGPMESSIELIGSVTARRQSHLSARTSGLIGKLNVDAGDVVKSGDLIMELDDELARISLEQAEIEREQALLELEDAKRLDEEARNLTKTGAFPRSEADGRATAVKIRSTSLRQAGAAEAEQRATVERHRLLAPFDGVISAKIAEEGEWVETGTPVVKLVETGSLRMDVQAPQEIYPLLESGPSVQVRLDPYPDQPLDGKIAVNVPVKDAVARTFLTRIEMEDPQGLAAAGMSGRVIFRFRTKEDVVSIPRDALIRFPDGTAKVWTVSGVGSGATVESRTVKPGKSLTESIEIVDGIDAGTRVVLRGNESLREGQPVEILPTPPAATHSGAP
jgi:RND family efflux transporter MFP subunit